MKHLRTVAALSVMGLLGASPLVAQKKNKGKPAPPLMRTQFANAATDAIQGVRDVEGETVPYYVDGRASTDPHAQPNAGVEVFLFGSGNVGLRLADSEAGRVLRLDFGNGVPVAGSCGGGCEPLPSSWGDGAGNVVIERSVEELNNNGTIDCPGTMGLSCLDQVGESAESRFAVRWVEDGFRFRVRMRADDDFVQGADPIEITRVDPSLDPGGQSHPTWTLSSLYGSRARVTSVKVKGKKVTRDHGVFIMPFALTVSCVAANCQ